MTAEDLVNEMNDFKRYLLDLRVSRKNRNYKEYGKLLNKHLTILDKYKTNNIKFEEQANKWINETKEFIYQLYK